MKRLIALACAGALLAACGTTGTTSARITAGKGLADAWAALDGASQTADAAAKAGLLHGQNAATAAQDLKLAQASLDAATTAYQAGSNGDAAAQIAAAASAVSAVLVIVAQAQKGN